MNTGKNSKQNGWTLVNFCEFDKYATKSYCAIHGVDESLNLGDITKVDETKLAPFNMICGGSPCFVKGTKVLTDSGYKNIEDVKVGDRVLTHKNRYMPVVRIGGEHEKNIYSLRVQGFLPTECTDYHPFYCKRDKDSKPEKIRLKDIKKGYYIGSHINHESKNDFHLSDEDCWILGRYVADGHIRKEKRKGSIHSYHYQCVLSIGNHKADKLKQMIKEHHYSCYPHTESVHRVVFSSMELVNFIIDNGFGRNAESKRIPPFILDLPVDKLQSFLDGYMAGDGCEIGGICQATTVSQELAMSLCLAIQKVYRVGCRIYFDERPDKCEIQGRIENQKDTYMIRFMRESQKQAWFIEDNIVWYPVKEIADLNKQADVYNIEVEEDHTYTANNMIVYNCQDFSVAGKQKGSIWTCKDCGHEYNPLTVHWSERDKCPDCHSENIEKTRSSLLVEYLRVIRANRPNFGMYENVKNIVGKQFKDTFQMFTDELDEYGYNVYWKVLNAKDYGVPQNRERVYLIFIRKELDNGKFVFPEGFDSGIRLRDILEDEVDEKYYLSDEKVSRFLINLNHTAHPSCEADENAVKQVGNISECSGSWNNPQVGRIYSTEGCSPTLNICGSGSHEPKILQIGRINSSQDGVVVSDEGISKTHTAGHNNMPKVLKVGNVNPSGNGMNGNVFSDDGLSPTLTTNKGEGNKILSNPRIRKLTPKECFRLMGFDDSAYEAASKVVSNSQMYKQTGNSIVVDVLYYILVELYKAMPYLFDDLRLSSFFSGIGAFEIALNRLYKFIGRPL